MYKTKKVTIPLAELIEDMDLYPRHAIDSVHVRSLVLALEAGIALPLFRVDAKSKRITDGWHRSRAYRRFLGREAVIDVELVEYPNEAAMLFDAVRQNSSHGRRLDAIDQTRSVLMLTRHNFDAAHIAAALNVPEIRVQKLTLKTATGAKGALGVVPGTNQIVLKRPVLHLQGRKLTHEQAEVHGMLPGTSFLLIARQLFNALHASMVDLKDARLIAQLRELRDQLVTTLG